MMDFEKDKPSVSEATSSSSNTQEHERIKTKQEFLEDMILRHATCNKPISSPDATDEEKAADRLRILNARTTRWRHVFLDWPRDPKGKFITPENSALGKMAPNKAELWGATIFNFYSTRRFPDITNLVTLSSGSKLAAWMKANGEDYAKDQLEFAENEEDPHIVLPYEITELIRDYEIMNTAGMSDKSWISDEQDEGETVGGKRKREGKGKEKEREYWQVPQPWPPASPFDPIAYPKPWPIQPFTGKYPKLEKYIIHSRLPKILKVHDPWNLLRLSNIYSREELAEEKKKAWSDKTDIVHSYRLKTSTKHTARRMEDDKLAEEEETRRKTVYDKFIADPHSRNEPPSGILLDKDQERQPGPTKPPIFVVLPFQPPIPPAREAHLYLSPAELIGEGNHSLVYGAEFELPRSTFMEDEICHKCIMDDAYRTLMEEDGPNGERRDPKWDEKVGCYTVEKTGKPLQSMLVDGDTAMPGTTEYLFEPCTLHLVLKYDGPFRLIHSKIGYQCLERGPYCEHIATSNRGIHPLTAKVKVAAKLSVQHDLHLGREAEIYQAFPRHFFEHWSGFNLIKPLKEPTPVGPLVPQFYGYYVPDISPDQSDSESLRSEMCEYLSPILLLEYCGKQIKPQKLTLDDQNEAAALVFRFHDAGWIHGSIAQRNILIQPGPLSDYPLARALNAGERGGHGVDWSFRLIDFGRSYDIKDRPDRDRQRLIAAEEIDIQNWILFGGGLN